MISTVPLLSTWLKHYMAHRLRAKVQFHSIELVKQWIKADPEKHILIVMDHKQKVQNMKYREGQVEYYGKKGMSVLGTMVVQWLTKDDSNEMGFQYSFVDYIIAFYSGQDNVQVCAILQLICSSVQKKFPNVKEICIQSDNST